MPADPADPTAPDVAVPIAPPASGLLARAAERQARAEQLNWFLVKNDGANARPQPLLALGLLFVGLSVLRLFAGVSSFVELLEWIGAAAVFLVGVALARRGTRAIRWRRAHVASAHVLAKAFTARVQRGISRESNRWFDAHWAGEGGLALDEERLAIEAVVHGCAVLVEVTPAGPGARVVAHVGGLVPPSASHALERLRAWVDSSGYEVIVVDRRMRIVRGHDSTIDASGRWQVDDAERLVVVLREITSALANHAALSGGER